MVAGSFLYLGGMMKKNKDEEKIQYTKEDTFIFTKTNFEYSNAKRHREVRLFCRTLWFCLTVKERLRFIFTGNYRKSVIKAYDELLSKKDFVNEETLMREIDRYYGSELRVRMITLCTNLFSEMSRFYRLLFVITGIHYVPLQQTNKRMVKQQQKKQKKQQKRVNRIIAKQNKEIAKKKKNSA